MDLKTHVVIDMYLALTELRGAPTLVENERGKSEVVYEPYPLSDKARWNSAKNREILKRLVVAHDEVKQDMEATLKAYRKEQALRLKGVEDPQLFKETATAVKDAIQEKTDQLNEEMRKIAREVQKVDGLLRIPAKGLVVKGSRIPPTIISELMPLIEGEPEFPDTPSPAK